jgi:UDP-2,4-diacetamido-2,4,6-trideoxy-beta-L-altropyranose hydrolase
MIKKRIYFRVDGNSKIGLGHVIRSLSLCHMVKDKFDCFFLLKDSTNDVKEVIRKSCEVIEINGYFTKHDELKWILNNSNFDNSIIVLDGYHYDTTYQAVFKILNCKVVTIDDIHSCHFVSDCIINHSISAKVSDYSADLHTKKYFGLNYALIRESFLAHASKRSKRDYDYNYNKNVFISLGGADPNNNILDVLKYLKKNGYHAGLIYHIVLGSAYTQRKAFDKFLKRNRLDVKVHTDLSEIEIYELMRSCSIAITSPSSVAIEYMAIGGGLYLYCIADNQIEFYNEMVKKKYAFQLNSIFTHTFNDHLKMFIKHCKLIDGRQKARVVSIFKKL